MSKKVGDVVKLISNPSVDWMHNYLDKVFEVVDFPTKNGVKLLMVDSEPEWVWIIGKDNVELACEAG